MGEQDGVRPLDRGPHATPRPGAQVERSERRAAASRDPLRFPDAEDPLLARRSFVRRGVWRDLCAGRIRPDRRIDLHGLDQREAKREVVEAVGDAARASARCLLVVAGRGRHSADGVPVIRNALPGWLAGPDVEQWVAAFAPATASDGGRGAVYVLLR
jgi:DNA-nicking Smr family endonuclease